MPLLTVDHTAHPQQLWWLGRDDHAHALAGDVPALPCPPSCLGIATGHGMLVAWSRQEAYVYALRAGARIGHLQPSRTELLACWIEDGHLLTAERDTFGHPTDRRSQLMSWDLDAPAGTRAALASGDGLLPLHFRGTFDWKKSVLWAGTEGHVERYHREWPFRHVWVEAATREQVTLPEHASEVSWRALTYRDRPLLAAWHLDEVFLYERRTMSQVASLQRPGSIRDVVIFDHDLWMHTFDEPPTRVPEVTVSLA
jgi:hypothetical protein